MSWIYRLMLMVVVSGCSIAPPRPIIDIDALRASRQLMEAGNMQLRAGDLAQATSSYELAYQLGQEAEALDGLGCIAAQQGRYDEALKYFEAALERSPNLTEAYGHIAAVLEQKGALVEAQQHYTRGLEIRPGDIQLRLEYAQFLKRTGRRKESEILMQQVSSMIPKSLQLRLKGS